MKQIKDKKMKKWLKKLKKKEQLHLESEIAKLEPADINKIIQQKRILADLEMQLSMTRYSHQILWQNLAKKYKLPAEFIFDDESGKIYLKEETNE